MKTTRRNFMKRALALAGGSLMAPAVFGRKKTALPRVLILGDSISIGYTPYVKEMLAGEAEVDRPAENCQGTKNGILKIDQWLGDTKWDVIHFNFGLHDLKHVDALTGKNSDKEEDPHQSDVDTYAKNLKEITKKLRATGAKLIFATTTPYPDKVNNPLRKLEDVHAYNRAALKVMKKYRIKIDDLYSFALTIMASHQIPNNVHFTKDGSKELAGKVVESIRSSLFA